MKLSEDKRLRVEKLVNELDIPESAEELLGLLMDSTANFKPKPTYDYKLESKNETSEEMKRWYFPYSEWSNIDNFVKEVEKLEQENKNEADHH